MSNKQATIILDAFMKKIADILIACAPDCWERISLKYSYDEGYLAIDVSAIINREHLPLELSDKAVDALEVVYDEIKVANPGDWNTINYFLAFEGDCELIFTHEDLDE